MEPEIEVKKPKVKQAVVVKEDVNSSEYISSIASKLKAGVKIEGSRRVVVVKASDSVFVYDAVEMTEHIIKKSTDRATQFMTDEELMHYVFGDMVRRDMVRREDGCVLITVEGL